MPQDEDLFLTQFLASPIDHLFCIIYHALKRQCGRDHRWIIQKVGLAGAALIPLNSVKYSSQSRLNHQLIGIET